MNSRAPRRRAGRPLPTGGPLFTPHASSRRRSVEGRSARVLLLLHQLPRWLVPAVLAAGLVAGLTVPGVGGAALLLVLAVVLGWFGYLSWPALTSQGRGLRAAAIVVVLLLAVLQLRR